jgi:kumamolisin
MNPPSLGRSKQKGLGCSRGLFVAGGTTWTAGTSIVHLDMRTLRCVCVALASVLTISFYGCGGGGGTGGGNRPPVAPEPTCSANQTPEAVHGLVAGGDPGILVPRTSQVDPSAIGRRVHTNHLILRSSLGRGVISGYRPSMMTTAYGVQTGGGTGAIAIVDAFNYPTALQDFNTFATTWGLPTEPSASVTAPTNTQFRIVYATGTKPADDDGWSQEAAIDIEWAHAMAPNAKIYLVEAASDALSDIMAAVNVAKALPNVKQVSMSFGNSEDGCSFVRYNHNFLRSGVTFFAAAGDIGGDRSFPAESYNVVAVGGTSLTLGPTGTWISESVWNSTGCGPSALEPRPVFQDGIYPATGTHRGTCDIAAIGDPNTGVAVYDSFPSAGVSGWFVAGGTSVSCPIVAGAVNAAGASFVSSQALNAVLYGSIGSANLHDITSGSSGGFGAAVGWDFPSGVGSPNGLAALFGGP